jgi:DNA-binding CsgD family transcriptional regulator/tetratricopeptide (TPR) repeat protein
VLQDPSVTELLEREPLLAELDAARQAGGRLVFVGGEAGVGKTALVREFAARVGDRVLVGACENLTTPTPLGPFLDVEDVAAAGEPRLVAHAVLDELRDGKALVVEDVHWADEATLDVLRVVGRRIDSTRALVLATYRDDEVDAAHPLRIVLGELASAPGVTRVSVPRLSLDAVRVLADPYDADADAIHELTRGNAFYVTEVLASGTDELPETVRDAVLARVARLEPDARRLLDAAALVPARCELWLLEAVAPDVVSRLDDLVTSGVLRVDGDAVVFRHELGRLAVESSVPAGMRRALHREILRTLRSPPVGEPDVARLAHHADEAGDAEAVLEFAREAGRRAAAMSARREAAAQFGRALRYADALPERERAELLVAFALEANVTGRPAEAIEARLRAVELFHALGDRAAEGHSWAELASPYIALGRNAEAEESSLRAIEILEPLGPIRELAYAYATQAYLRMLNRDNADGVRWGERAVELATEHEDDETLGVALNMVGTSHVMAGDIEVGISHLQECLELGARVGKPRTVAAALGMLGSGLGEMYELERSERYLREHIRFAEEHDFIGVYSESWLACLLAYRGDWAAASALAQQVLRRSDRSLISRITTLIALGRVRARRGDPGVDSVLEEALELARPGGHLQRLGHVHAARAEAAWLAGHRDRAVDEARAVFELALAKRHLWFAGELAYWQWKAGALSDAPEWIAEPYRLQLDGDPHGAARAWRARSCPYEAARALAETEDDEAALREALAEFDRLGAMPAAKLVRGRLRSLGVTVPRGPRESTRANPADLTSRELEVLRLVAAGKRNADVAAELVLSRRTVDHHMSSILRKLDVKTRNEAAAAASRLGLLQDR